MRNIYIVLSQTGTLFSRVIKQFTKDPYNHASISFDPQLEVMYSFGRRKRYNILNAGFIEENFDRGLFPYFPNARCCILKIQVTDSEYEAMQETVALFQRNLPDYRYNLLGVFTYAVGVRLARKNCFFCSQFVGYVLAKTTLWESIPELTKPMDFLNLPRKLVVYEGRIIDFTRRRFLT